MPHPFLLYLWKNEIEICDIKSWGKEIFFLLLSKSIGDKFGYAKERIPLNNEYKKIVKTIKLVKLQIRGFNNSSTNCFLLISLCIIFNIVQFAV